MKWSLKDMFILLMLVACVCWCYNCLPKHEFIFEQSVRVTGGFFKGQSGTIQGNCWCNDYEVRLGERFRYHTERIDGRNLEAIK